MKKARESTQRRYIAPYVLITPARNEARFVEGTIRSVAAQTVRPATWVIVSVPWRRHYQENFWHSVGWADKITISTAIRLGIPPTMLADEEQAVSSW